MTALVISNLAITSILFTILVAIAVIDGRHFIIPDRLNLALSLLGLVTLFFLQHVHWANAVAGSLFGMGLFKLVGWFYLNIRGRPGLGMGDLKFMGAAGLFTGLSGLPFFLFLASFSALSWVAFVGLTASVSGKPPPNAGSKIPFGPFLAIGLFSYWLWSQYFPDLMFMT